MEVETTNLMDDKAVDDLCATLLEVRLAFTRNLSCMRAKVLCPRVGGVPACTSCAAADVLVLRPSIMSRQLCTAVTGHPRLCSVMGRSMCW